MHPEEGKYRSSIIKFATHPSYSDIPIHNIAAIVTAKDQQKIGAQKERETREKVDLTKSVGRGFRDDKAMRGVDWSKASVVELEAEKARLFHVD